MVAAEASENARQWVSPATEERHQRALIDPTMLQLIVEDDGRPVGHVLLTGLERAVMGIEFRRYVVWEPGRGLGSAALPLVLEHCFDSLGTHRVWLDVMPDNGRARRVYQQAGFREEGLLRDALRRPDGSLVPLVLMAITAGEWRSRGAPGSR
jgi:diamine N-acetyltransferase